MNRDDRMYAGRKEWPLDFVTVRFSHSKIYADDCANCKTETGKIDRIERRIEVEGALDDAQRKKLLETADECPVHRTLTPEAITEDLTPARS